MSGLVTRRLTADNRGTLELVRLAHEGAPVAGARLVQSFVAGFASTLVFQQTGLGLLHLLGMTLATPWNFNSVPPFEMPAVISLAFWGGIWANALFLLHLRAPFARIRGIAFWVAAVIFGAVFPSLVGWFVVGPLKGLPVPIGFHVPAMLVSPIVNGLWGFGTVFFLNVLIRVRTEPA